MEIEKSRILITGVTGFLGRRLSIELAKDNLFSIRGTSRNNYRPEDQRIEIVRIGELGNDVDWSLAIRGVDIVVHTAARVHVIKENSKDPLFDFLRSNTIGTLRLAREAIKAGVKRFIFISSVKVCGEQNNICSPLSEKMLPVPQEAYGISKLEAEKGLFEIAKNTGMEVVVIRPPLVYGPGVKANFLLMLRWVSKGIPLPFGSIYNRRSLVFLDNIIDFIITCIKHPEAANQIFFVSDGEDLSTTELLKRLGKKIHKFVWLIPIPQKVVEIGFKMIGREDVGQRICGTLQVDISKAKQSLSWSPPVSVSDALSETVYWFVESERQ